MYWIIILREYLKRGEQNKGDIIVFFWNHSFYIIELGAIPFTERFCTVNYFLLSSTRGWTRWLFAPKTTLIKMLMSFYEDRKKIGEEDVDVRGKKQRMCLRPFVCKVFFQPPFCILPDLTCFMQRRNGRNVISYE
jgi:hypothetical protein